MCSGGPIRVRSAPAARPDRETPNNPGWLGHSSTPKGPGAASKTSSSPHPPTSTGSTKGGSSNRSETFHPPNTKPTTTVRRAQPPRPDQHLATELGRVPPRHDDLLITSARDSSSPDRAIPRADHPGFWPFNTFGPSTRHRCCGSPPLRLDWGHRGARLLGDPPGPLQPSLGDGAGVDLCRIVVVSPPADP